MVHFCREDLLLSLQTLKTLIKCTLCILITLDNVKHELKPSLDKIYWEKGAMIMNYIQKVTDVTAGQ